MLNHWFKYFLAVALAMSMGAHALAQSDAESEPAVQAVKKVLPAVVNIATERIIKRQVHDQYDLFYDEFFGGPMRPPRELQQKVQSLGSGFIVDSSGYIVTNEHVVERAADLKIQVTTSDGKTYEAKYITGDPASDLAFIKIEGAPELPFIDLNDPSPSVLGQTVLALGNPLGYGISVSRGILSALHRTITIDENEYKDLVQTDAAINPGNSGGPLIDISGKFIGVNSVKMAYSPQGIPTQGLGFAIPAKVVKARVVDFMEIAKRGPKPGSPATSKARLLFGLHMQDLTQDLAEAFGYGETKGALVADVDAGSPAAQAGFRRGLVIYRIGRHEVAGASDVERLFDQARTGTVADFTVGSLRRLRGQYVTQVQTVSLTAR